MRHPREVRDSLAKLRTLPIVTPRGARIVLSDVAALRVTDGSPILRSENARLAGFVYVDIRGRDLQSAVQDMQKIVAEQVQLTPGYAVSWSGQFEYLERATPGSRLVVPFTLGTIFLLLSLTFRRFDEALLILTTLPFALIGGFWLLYLKQAWEARLARGQGGEADVLEAIREGAVLRVRPKAMTVAVVIAGLMPIRFGGGTGSEVMQRIAAPMVGGMVTAPLLSMFVVPALYWLMRRQPRTRMEPSARVPADEGASRPSASAV